MALKTTPLPLLANVMKNIHFFYPFPFYDYNYDIDHDFHNAMVLGWGPFSIFVCIHKKMYRDEKEYTNLFCLKIKSQMINE